MTPACPSPYRPVRVCASCGDTVAAHTGWFGGGSDVAWWPCGCRPLGVSSLWFLLRGRSIDVEVAP